MVRYDLLASIGSDVVLRMRSGQLKSLILSSRLPTFQVRTLQFRGKVRMGSVLLWKWWEEKTDIIGR